MFDFGKPCILKFFLQVAIHHTVRATANLPGHHQKRDLRPGLSLSILIFRLKMMNKFIRVIVESILLIVIVTIDIDPIAIITQNTCQLSKTFIQTLCLM